MAGGEERPAKVAILHHGFIPPYRVRFYELLRELGKARYVVFHGQPATGTGWDAAKGPFDFPNREIENREIRLAGWTAIYQPVLREILSGGYDAVVLGHELKFISNLLLAALCRWKGIKVLFWGFGYHVRKPAADQTSLGWAKESVAVVTKNLVAKLGQGYMAYTKGGAEKLAAMGFATDRIWVLQNTIDMREQFRLRDALADTDPASLRTEMGVPQGPVVLLYVGRLLEDKRVDVLIEATRRLNLNLDHPRVVTLIVGGGPMEAALKELAGASPQVRFFGAIHDQARMARIMRIASAVVIPGFVGLAVNHAFAQGLPVITRKSVLHAPEIEYLDDGGNGIIVEGDEIRFFETLAHFVENPEWRAKLALGARRSGEELRIERMVEQFDEAVRSVIAR